jgi:PleD family two-component response regulator
MWAACRLLAKPRSPITIFRREETMTVQVLAITSDLFLQSRITELAKSLGASATLVTNEEELLEQADLSAPNLVVLDLASSDYDPFFCAQKLKAIIFPPKILGIFPHIRTDLKLKGENVMIDYIVPNSSFLKTLKSVLEKEVLGK